MSEVAMYPYICHDAHGSAVMHVRLGQGTEMRSPDQGRLLREERRGEGHEAGVEMSLELRAAESTRKSIGFMHLP